MFVCLPCRSLQTHAWILVGSDSSKCSSQANLAYISMLAVWNKDRVETDWKEELDERSHSQQSNGTILLLATISPYFVRWETGNSLFAIFSIWHPSVWSANILFKNTMSKIHFEVNVKYQAWPFWYPHIWNHCVTFDIPIGRLFS